MSSFEIRVNRFARDGLILKSPDPEKDQVISYNAKFDTELLII